MDGTPSSPSSPLDDEARGAEVPRVETKNDLELIQLKL